MVRQRKSKRQLIRDEKRSKKLKRAPADAESRASKRQKRKEDERRDDALGFWPVRVDHADQDNGDGGQGPGGRPEREYFGMLADEEQEEFRSFDEELGGIQVPSEEYPSEEDRRIYIDKVIQKAQGKALKLASSQSCSRLMERLIQVSTTAQKKALFGEFSGHFLSLVTHRFASHCCERLFLECAPVVTEELLGLDAGAAGSSGVDTYGNKNKPDAAAEALQSMSMEQLLLLMLDELEGHMPFLLTDRFASHTMRVLLVVLSGRPLDTVATKALLRSKKKESITAKGALVHAPELHSSPRVVPESFTLAVQKIISDSTQTLDSTALRVLAQHPTGNPVLQLLLDLDLSMNHKSAKRKEKDAPGAAQNEGTLLDKLLPDAPASLGDPESPASALISSLVYDPVGSRLLETLITGCPGRVFKALYSNILGPRIDSLLRNEIASYPAIRAVNRLSKEDLVEAVDKSLHIVPQLLERGRFNVLQSLLERCDVRQARESTEDVMKALGLALPSGLESLVPTVCFPESKEVSVEKREGPRPTEQAGKKVAASTNHGCNLVATMLKLAGAPRDAAQSSLVSLEGTALLTLATTSNAAAGLVMAALAAPSANLAFHKRITNALMGDLVGLAESLPGHRILDTLARMPCKGDGAIPFHTKEAIMAQLAGQEQRLKESWTGREVWRTWKGDLWRRKRFDWNRWIKSGQLAAGP
jgi:nucleolar protein 9